MIMPHNYIKLYLIFIGKTIYWYTVFNIVIKLF